MSLPLVDPTSGDELDGQEQRRIRTALGHEENVGGPSWQTSCFPVEPEHGPRPVRGSELADRDVMREQRSPVLTGEHMDVFDGGMSGKGPDPTYLGGHGGIALVDRFADVTDLHPMSRRVRSTAGEPSHPGVSRIVRLTLGATLGDDPYRARVLEPRTVTGPVERRYPRQWRYLIRKVVMFKRAPAPLELVRDHPLSLLTGLRHRQSFAEIDRYLVFVGASRSGHSLVGSLLNAHPDVVVAHQLHGLRYVAAGFNRTQLLGMILRTDWRYGRRGRVSNKGRYHYAVPGQWQGRYRTLRFAGDKRGASSATLLDQRPELLDRLRSVLGVPIRIVHVIRNPFDNIATMSVRFRVHLPEGDHRRQRVARPSPRGPDRTSPRAAGAAVLVHWDRGRQTV